MDTKELIAAINELALDENSDWTEDLRREMEALEDSFEDLSRRLRMSAAELEMVYEI